MGSGGPRIAPKPVGRGYRVSPTAAEDPGRGAFSLLPSQPVAVAAFVPATERHGCLLFPCFPPVGNGAAPPCDGERHVPGSGGRPSGPWRHSPCTATAAVDTIDTAAVAAATVDTAAAAAAALAAGAPLRGRSVRRTVRAGVPGGAAPWAPWAVAMATMAPSSGRKWREHTRQSATRGDNYTRCIV